MGVVDGRVLVVTPPPDLSPGDLWTILVDREPATVQTADGPVVVPRGGVGRFVMTTRGLMPRQTAEDGATAP